MNSSATKAKQRHCFAPGCTTGYVSSRQQGQKVSLFSVPKDPALFEAWRRAVPRADKSLDAKSVLCERHFDEQYIERFFTHVINGETVQIPRERPVLKLDAVPTAFPNVPAYLSKKPPKKRTSRTSTCGLPSKIRRQEPNTSACEETDSHSAEYDGDQVPVLNSPAIPDVRKCGLPSAYWARHLIAGADNVTVFAVCALYGDKICFEKYVLMTSNENTVRATVFVQGTKIKTVDITDTDMAEELLRDVNCMIPCGGFGKTGEFGVNPKYKEKTFGDRTFSPSCRGVAQTPEKACPQCKHLRRLLRNRESYRRRRGKTRVQTLSYRLKLRTAQAKRSRLSLLQAKSRMKQMKEKNAQNDSTAFEEAVKALPVKQQSQVKACFAACRRKSTKGMKYESEWALECLIMSMKSPRLYEHIRKNKIMTLPSRTSLRRYLKSYRSGFGLSEKVFAAVAEKTKSMDSFQRHGGLLIDEIKLSEHLSLGSDGTIEGFVDLGKFTPESERSVACDHGLVVLFVPFTGTWHQIIGVFASRSNVKSEMLGKIILEAVVMCENAGLHVDFITTDGAAWNRSMWHSFGIHGRKENTVCRRQHPTDPERFLHFISDFPHLVKCVRNTFVRTGVRLPEGHASVDPIDCARKLDEQHDTTLKAMPHISTSVVRPNGFEKMRVNYAVRLYSDEVLRGLFLYNEIIEEKHGSTAATVSFVETMRRLIEAMTSRCSSGALKPGGTHEKCIENFLAYLDEWETAAGSGGFLSRSTAEGLRVTLSSTLHLLRYLTTKLKFSYMMTCRLSQDPLERLFGIIRQMSGCNDHPTPSQFLISVNTLSFQNLAKPPKGSNVSSGLLRSLLGADNGKDLTSQRKLDELLDAGNLAEAHEVLSECGHGTEHVDMVVQTSDARLIYYMAGYVARKSVASTKCAECSRQLLQGENDSAPGAASLTAAVDRGGLLYPSAKLNELVTTLENTFTHCFSVREVKCDSIMDLVSFLQLRKLTLVGCPDHSMSLTNKIMKFYVLTRLHFHVKAQNNKRNARQERMKLLKLRRVL
ncbi:uncharacterized protein LOC125944849 [Dermacentor silvarum]|uniref:uncharacterized protein LOC125944849 n=1 Tax=Dermacentor silvarum TaxID=543639 RepID=UPI00210119B1|nr:uncharacterized protein LOC125944849 [Dermacentor silvarum]